MNLLISKAHRGIDVKITFSFLVLCCAVMLCSGRMSAWAAESTMPTAPPPNTSPKPVLGQQGAVLGQMQAQSQAQQGQAQDEAKAAQEKQKEAGSGQQKPQGQDAQALFEESLRQMMPLDKNQIQNFREWSDQRDRALLPVSPTLNSRTVRVSLEPGRAPVKVFTTANVATSLVFHDVTGQPWPVTSVTNGGPSFFQILRPELPDGNLLNVMPQQAYGASTIVVTLAKRDVPLVIRLESDSVRSPERKADAMVLFQVAHYGPNAQAPIIQDIKATANSAMLAFLDHVPPSGSVRVRFEPADEKVEVWKLNNTLYIRTSHTLMWPAWLSVVNGAGDVKCYEAPVTPRLLISQQGQIKTVRIKEQSK